MSRISNLLKRGKAKVAALRGRPSIAARSGRGSRIVLHCAKDAFREMRWHLPRPGRRPSLRGKARSRLRQGLRSQPPKAAEAVDPEDAALLEADLSQGIWVELKLLAEFEYRAKSAEGKVRYDFQGTARGPLTARGRAVGGRTIGENGRLMLSALAARSVRFEATDVADRQRFGAAGRTTRTRNDPEPRQGTWLAHSAGSRSREPMLGRTKQLSSCPSDRWL